MLMMRPCRRWPLWGHGLTEREGAAQVDGENLVPISFRHVEKIGSPDDPGIVDENVDPARACNNGVKVGTEREIAADFLEVSTCCFDAFARIGHGGRSQTNDICAGISERQSHGLPQSGARAGYEGDLACEIKKVRAFHSPDFAAGCDWPDDLNDTVANAVHFIVHVLMNNSDGNNAHDLHPLRARLAC